MRIRPLKPIIKLFKNSRVLSFLCKNLVYGIIRLLFFTYRLEVSYDKGLVGPLYKQPGVFYFWHQSILSGMFFFFKMKGKGYCVVSPSGDGKFAGYICKKLGFNVLYGSSKKNSTGLVRQALSVLKDRSQLCLIGDGSRGPAFKLQKGISYLAQKTDVPLVFVECNPTRTWTFTRSWDQFQLPLPFSKISVKLHRPIYPAVKTTFDTKKDDVRTSSTS